MSVRHRSLRLSSLFACLLEGIVEEMSLIEVKPGPKDATEDSISHSPLIHLEMHPVLTFLGGTIGRVALQRLSILRGYPGHHLLSSASFDPSNNP